MLLCVSSGLSRTSECAREEGMSMRVLVCLPAVSQQRSVNSVITTVVSLTPLHWSSRNITMWLSSDYTGSCTYKELHTRINTHTHTHKVEEGGLFLHPLLHFPDCLSFFSPHPSLLIVALPSYRVSVCSSEQQVETAVITKYREEKEHQINLGIVGEKNREKCTLWTFLRTHLVVCVHLKQSC